MSSFADHINELSVAEAFGRQSSHFDKDYSSNPIIQYKRKRVREHALRYLPPNSSILELNCGTGEDALFFAQEGYHVHATDVSEGMVKELERKVVESGVKDKVTYELCSFNELAGLNARGPYDMILSNFGGLNCTGDLKDVLSSFPSLVKPGGVVTLVIIPPFCLWESLLLLKGEFKNATRRWFSRGGRKAQIDGVSFRCWYYTPEYVKRHLGDQFDVLGIEGLCTLVPPSYRENFPGKYPKLFSFLMKAEDRLKAVWPWRGVGDYFIISLRKR